MSDIDTIVVDSLKALDPEWPLKSRHWIRRVYEYHPLVPCHPTAAPPPWTVADNGAAFIVKDRGGKTLAYSILRAGARPARCGESADER